LIGAVFVKLLQQQEQIHSSRFATATQVSNREGAMKDLDEVALGQLEGGSWLGDFGAGFSCGVAIGMAAATGGVLVLVAVGACLMVL
jgi:hypothetical protein